MLILLDLPYQLCSEDQLAPSLKNGFTQVASLEHLVIFNFYCILSSVDFSRHQRLLDYIREQVGVSFKGASATEHDTRRFIPNVNGCIFILSVKAPVSRAIIHFTS